MARDELRGGGPQALTCQWLQTPATQVRLPLQLRQKPPSLPQLLLVLPTSQWFVVVMQQPGHALQLQVEPLHCSPTAHCGLVPQ
jgi:hypothetical protein